MLPNCRCIGFNLMDKKMDKETIVKRLIELEIDILNLENITPEQQKNMFLKTQSLNRLIKLLPIHDVMCSYDITFEKHDATWIIKQVDANDEKEACKIAHQRLVETIRDSCGYKVTDVKKFEP